MTKEHISIKEIVRRTGKSDSTIRRLLKQQPEPDRAKHSRMDAGRLVISWSWVKKCLGIDQGTQDKLSHHAYADSYANDYINLLKEQLHRQQTEINRLHRIIEGLVWRTGNHPGQVEDGNQMVIPGRKKKQKKKGRKKNKKGRKQKKGK